MTDLAPILQGFFTDRLARQKKASPNTVAAYRDTCKLLLSFAQGKTGKAPSRLGLADLDAALIGAFLQHLEDHRGNGSATRNARLAAVHSLFRYAAPQGTRARCRDQPSPGDPATAARTRHRQLPHPRGSRRADRRPRPQDLARTPRSRPAPAHRPDRAAAIRDHRPRPPGHPPGRRPARPLSRQGPQGQSNPAHRANRQGALAWLAELGPAAPDRPLFPTQAGGPLSHDAVERLVAKHATAAADSCPSVKEKNVTPHTLRHTAAMSLLKAGVDTSVIALWLGHEDPETTQVYLHADMTIKEQALARVQQPRTTPGRYRPTDTLLTFLDNL